MRTTNPTEGAPSCAADRTLPADPIIAFVENRGGLHATLDPDSVERNELMRLRLAYHRAGTEGRVTLTMADELCILLLGLHPILVYGDDWLLAGAATWPAHDPTKGKFGSNSAYSYGCRCYDCTLAHGDYGVLARTRKKARKQEAKAAELDARVAAAEADDMNHNADREVVAV